MRIVAVLFDVDGTLLDTERYIFGAFDATLRAAGVEPGGRDTYRQVVGYPLDACYRQLAPDVDPAVLCEHHREWQVRHLDLVRPMPGAAALLDVLARRGIRLGAVTNRSGRSSDASLTRAGLRAALATVVSAEDVTRQKPDPEPVRLAVTRLGVPASGAVMVGDTAVDVLSGRGAGARTIGVTFGFAGRGIRDAGPDATADTFEQVGAVIDAWARTSASQALPPG